MKLTAVVLGASFALFAGASDADTIPERMTKDLQKDFSLTEPQSIGIVAALAAETTNFTFLQELKPIVSGSRGGLGYAQWTASRRRAFEAWAGEGADLTSYEVNYGYLKHELEGDYSRVLDQVREKDTAEEAMKVFTAGYLRPHKLHQRLEVRADYAQAYLSGDFSDAGCAAFHSVKVDGRKLTVQSCEQRMVEVEVMPYLYELMYVTDDGRKIPISETGYLTAAARGAFNGPGRAQMVNDPDQAPFAMTEAPKLHAPPAKPAAVAHRTSQLEVPELSPDLRKIIDEVVVQAVLNEAARAGFERRAELAAPRGPVMD